MSTNFNGLLTQDQISLLFVHTGVTGFTFRADIRKICSVREFSLFRDSLNRYDRKYYLNKQKNEDLVHGLRQIKYIAYL